MTPHDRWLEEGMDGAEEEDPKAPVDDDPAEPNDYPEEDQ